jgi:type II secretory pathway component PulK
MSIDELRMIQGFDATLVEAIRPYVTVHPFVGGAGINLNTAPPHVLSLLYFDDGVSLRFVKEDTIRAILEAREGENLVCTEGQNFDFCTPISDLMTNANTIFPPPTTRSNAFTVVSEARVGEIRRRIEAAFDRTNPMEPIWLSWRTR